MAERIITVKKLYLVAAMEILSNSPNPDVGDSGVSLREIIDIQKGRNYDGVDLDTHAAQAAYRLIEKAIDKPKEIPIHQWPIQRDLGHIEVSGRTWKMIYREGIVTKEDLAEAILLGLTKGWPGCGKVTHAELCKLCIEGERLDVL